MPVACGVLATAALALLGAVNVVAATSEIVPLFISASHPSQQGFVRIINHSAQSGTVAVTATDDVGRVAGTERFDLAAWETRHFNSDDLEFGHAAKGFVGVGPGSGDWRLAVESELPLEVLTYVRTSDGFLTSMHDWAAVAGDNGDDNGDGNGDDDGDGNAAIGFTLLSE